MNPTARIKRDILLDAQENSPDEFRFGPLDTIDEIDEAYDLLTRSGAHWDYEYEFRTSGIETGLPSEYSRHYESRSVGTKLRDGSWVGWTYWYGGGKHGAPERIDWMSDAYDLNCTDEEKVMTVRTFTKAEV